MPNALNLAGKAFGRLTPVSRAPSGHRGSKWLCLCTCGNTTTVATRELRTGDTKSCGCWKRDAASERMSLELTGRTFCKWTVLDKVGGVRTGYTLWNCKCECGIVRKIRGAHLTSGNSKSCGCLSGEIARKLRSGSRSSWWKGGRAKASGGYILVTAKDHPNANSGGYVLEHVFVMSKKLGRGLQHGEVVHHRNGIRSDNRMENLELRTRKTHPQGQSVDEMVAFCTDYLQTYAPNRLSEAWLRLPTTVIKAA